MRKEKAIIFDMDGVLFDTETFYYRRREIFLEGKGISIDHLEPNIFIGGNMRQIWKLILQENYENWDIGKLQDEYSMFKESNPLPYKNLIFSDTENVIKELAEKGFRLALASSSTMNDILRALYETGIASYFDVILSGENFREGKPNPAIYKEAVKQLKCENSEVLVIEDSEKGILAGVSAELEVWAIEDKYFGMNQSLSDKLVADLTQVLDCIIK